MNRRFRSAIVWPVGFLIIMGLTGCSPDKEAVPCVVPLTGTVKFDSGSVASPWHYEWTATFGIEDAELVMTPGYDSDQMWQASFATDQDALEQWCKRIVGDDSQETPPTGGTSLWADLTTANGEVVSSYVPSAIADSVGSVVPNQHFDQLFTQFEVWQKNQM